MEPRLYIAAARNSVYPYMAYGLINTRSGVSSIAEWRDAYPSDHLTNRNLWLDVLYKTAQVIVDFPLTTLQFPDLSRFSL